MFRISKFMRVLTVITIALILTNAIIVSIRQSQIEKQNDRLPLWVMYSTGTICVLISLCLLFTLAVLLKTFNTYVKGRLRRETLWIRKYFSIFSLTFTFMTVLIIVSYAKQWNLQANFF